MPGAGVACGGQQDISSKRSSSISGDPVHGMVCHGPLLSVEDLCIMMTNAFNGSC